MSLYYLDTSALVKYYVLEPGSTFVRGLVDDISNTISISDASIAESAAAFAILFRTHRISRRTQESAFHALMRDVARSSLKAMPLMTIDFQVKAGQAEGLLTDNPFEHVSPQDAPRANRTTL
jgi:predicted nucleic acid-binding protein